MADIMLRIADEVHYKYRETEYHIHFKLNAGTKAGSIRIAVDGQAQPGQTLRLVDDRLPHAVEVSWE